MAAINGALMTLVRGYSRLFSSISRNQDVASVLWASLDQAVQSNECEIYSYVPDVDNDPFAEEGGL